jgi:hypothetical protein
MSVKTISERLQEEGKVIISKEDMEDAHNNVPFVSLFTKLEQLRSRGVIESKLNWDTGGSRYYYKGNLINTVNGVIGKGEYAGAPVDGFETPHDIAVCHTSQQVLAWAPSLL